MLTMAQVNYIRKMFFEKGMNYAEIARATGHDVKTVKKYIHMDNFNAPPPKPVKRHSSKLDRFKPEIDSWLEADKRERKKQRHTAMRVYNRLREIHGFGFDCS
jgi:transposase